MQLESDFKYRAVFDAAPYPIVLLNADGLVVDANPSATALYGYLRDEMLGLHATRLLGDDSLIGELFSARPSFVPATTHRRRDGSRFFAETTLSFISQRDQLLVLAVVRDVTEEQLHSRTASGSRGTLALRTRRGG